MAITLTKTLSSGVNANYFRISNVRINRDTQKVNIVLDLYLSQTDRQANMDPVSTVSADLSSSYSSLMSQTSANIVAACYVLVMALPQFIGSTEN
jgi:hypothetical protein